MNENASVLLIAALAAAWTAIRQFHPGVPGVVIIPAPHGRKAGVLGHFAPLRWRPSEAEALTHEVVVVAEYLDRGASDVFETLLHEAVRAFNFARGIKDCSANQYHNRAFKTAAESLGLTVQQVPHYGFAYTKLAPETQAQYQRVIDGLAAVMIHRRGTPATPNTPPRGGLPDAVGGDSPSSPSRQRKAVCACGFIIRASRKTLTDTVIRCESCGERFESA
jgi:hypothetical protein